MAGDGSARFPSTMRLKRRKEFRRVYKEGISWKGSRFSLRVLPRQGSVLLGDDPWVEQRARLGMVVSRRCGSAVERNRIKRRIREAFRHVSKRLPATDVLVFPESGLFQVSVEDLGRELARAVHRALESAKERR